MSVGITYGAGRPADFFPGVGKLSGLGNGSPRESFRDAAPVVVSGGQAPISWHVLKIMHKYFGYWDLRQHLLAANEQ